MAESVQNPGTSGMFYRQPARSWGDESDLVTDPDAQTEQSGDFVKVISEAHSTGGWGDRLTINYKWKVEKELGDKLNQARKPSRVVPVAKWVITILIGSAMTCLFVVTKLSFITMSQALNVTDPLSGPSQKNILEWVTYTGQFLAIYLMLTIPNLLLFLRAAWLGLCNRQERWPRGLAVFCCVLSGTLEPLGLVILAFKVLPYCCLSLGVLILSSILVLPTLVETVHVVKQGYKSMTGAAMIVSNIFTFVALGVTMYMVHTEIRDSDSKLSDILHVAAGLISLNIAWSPRLLRIMTQTSSDGYESARGYQFLAATADSETEETISSHSSEENLMRVVPLPRRRETIDNKAPWKASIILYGIKTVAISLFSFIFFYIDTGFLPDSFTELSHRIFLDAWDFSAYQMMEYTWIAFGVNLIGSLVCYIVAFFISHTNMRRGCLAIPFVLSVPLSILVASVPRLCDALIRQDVICYDSFPDLYFIIIATVAVTIAQTLSFGWTALKKGATYLQKEAKVFWIPGYNGAIIDLWLLLDRKHAIKGGQGRNRQKPKSWKTRVYICTTMYREDEGEMRQLLDSLAKVNAAQVQGKTFFESHIVVDAGIEQKHFSQFALVLISLLQETLGVEPAACTKLKTPYGMKLSWCLPTARGKPRMNFNIHLKDNALVKNKKRWSQIMYMSYVLDFLSDTAESDEEVYILTTDADVMFTPDSVEALLDLMTKDSNIGAVCARTHPMGSGPLVWYQTFEYAIGHWFQKAAEHVLGSVLCAPGCFSVYRCRALHDVLPMYSKKVESAFDFLTKDMGEDRWLCTLMIQSGWRIEYCAAAENSTNCPSEFEEFYKQRRRWIASTLANLMLIIKEWRYINLFNHGISVVFLLYQVLLLFSTLIAPSTVVLVVAGGLSFGWNINAVAAVILQIVFSAMFAVVCIFAEPKLQIFLAKLYTFLYAVVMCAVTVGTAEQIVTDIYSDSENLPGNHTLGVTVKPPNQHISIDIPVSVTTIYFGFLVSIFLLAGLLHPRELMSLLHGVCFLLCIPSAYLVLMIYSVCNLTDSSWGTREGDVVSSTVKKLSWKEVIKKAFFTVFFCFAPKSKQSKGIDVETQTDINSLSNDSLGPMSLELYSIVNTTAESGIHRATGTDSEASDEEPRPMDQSAEQETGFTHIPVEEWLHPDLRGNYAELFKEHGFDNTLFIKGLTETDLQQMGIKSRGQMQSLLAKVAELPSFEIEYKIPTNVTSWLHEIGLAQYNWNFQSNHIETPREMEILKKFSRQEIEKELRITKQGHVKRLMDAIRKLRDPSESQIKSMKMRQVIDDVCEQDMQEMKVDEHDFWVQLKEKCLLPDLKAFGIDAEIKVKLVELRNSWLLVMAVANTLWLILITTLASKGDLTFLGTNPLGLLFLVIFGLLFMIQFFAMIIHRISTLSHYIARAPYTYGKPFKTFWSFQDKADHDDDDVIVQAEEACRRALRSVTSGSRRDRQRYRSYIQHGPNERTSLLSENSNY